jgi:hypothetical protein
MTRPSFDTARRLADWEDEGGATPSARGRADEAATERREDSASEERRSDAAHESGVRGEHRFPDAHQTEAEQKTRNDRDRLRRRLAGKTRV